MKKIDAGQMMAILANMGVLVGIVFLWIEIRQANVQTRVVNQTAIVGQTISLQAGIANDADASGIYFRGMNGYADLSAEDRMRFDLMMQSLLGRYAASMDADSAGLGIDARSYIGRNIAIYFEREGFRQWWAEMDRRSLPRPVIDFISEVEGYVAAEGP